MKDYIKLYKCYYGIEFGDEYEVHHLDGDRSNNNIYNLLLLPAPLHSRYHLLKNSVEGRTLFTGITGDVSSPNSYLWKMMQNFMDCLDECNRWATFKLILEGYPLNMPAIDTKGIRYVNHKG